VFRLRATLLALLATWPVGAKHIGRSRRSLHLWAHAELFPNNTRLSNHVCQVPREVSSADDANERCPEACPLYVARKDVPCDFVCVGASTRSCAEINPDTPVVDKELGICRRCKVTGCDTCRGDGTERCDRCQHGYQLNSQLQCEIAGFLFVAWCFLIFAVTLFGLMATLAFAWIVDLFLRKPTNPEGLAHGLELRSRAKLHMPKEPGDRRRFWPLWGTNLCKQEVAGPAVLLLFNFQAAIIFWALVLALAWFLLAAFVDWDLLGLGTRHAETPRQSCIIVKWGYETQRRLMYAKSCYLLFAYIFSFVGAMLFGIRQLRLYQRRDKRHSHKDFCAVLKGLPQLPGTRKVEEELQKAIEGATAHRLVGVSVGWEVGDYLKTFAAMMDLRLNEIDPDSEYTAFTTHSVTSRAVTALKEPRPLYARFRAVMMSIESIFIHPTAQKFFTRGRRRKKLPGKGKNLEGMGETLDREVVKERIEGLTTSSTAFAVFETEADRDEAVRMLKKTGLDFAGTTLAMKRVRFEPNGVLWQNLRADHGLSSKLKKFAMMSGLVLMIIILLNVFEGVYARIQLGHVSATGEEGSAFNFTLLISTMTIAMMMAMLCLVSMQFSETAKFERVGQREQCFMLLYTFSVILQVALDLRIGYWVSKTLMDVNSVRTYDGTLIKDLHARESFTQVFGAYAMQKQLGTTVLSFAFPCAFLLPFLAEPIFLIFLPYKIMSLLVGSHSDIQGSSAEGYLEAIPMDLGRYGDLMINAIIAVLIFFFPGGFNLTMFLFLAGCHTYIYCLDHYRVLRSIPTICISSSRVDWWAQWLFSLPCAIILSAYVYKGNCQHHGGFTDHCKDGFPLLVEVVTFFVSHIVLHTLLLLYVVPAFGKADEENPSAPYSETATRLPCSWFSTNLMHCLRSEYIYKHDPPFDFCVSGKEHLVRMNPDIGAYFTDSKAEVEDWDEPISPISVRFSW